MNNIVFCSNSIWNWTKCWKWKPSWHCCFQWYQMLSFCVKCAVC